MPDTAQVLASQIMTALGHDFTIPSVDLSTFVLPTDETTQFGGSPAQLSFDDLTTGQVNGNGAFDKLMSSNKEHLKEQFEKGRITADQFAKAYAEMTTAAMNTALQFLLQKDASYWQTKLIQMQGRRAEVEAVVAGIQLEVAKVELAVATRNAALVNAQYVLTQMQIANADAAHHLTLAQITQAETQTALGVTQRDALLKEIELNDYKLDNTMPQELANLSQTEQVLHAQERLVTEQGESERAKTMDIRNDGVTPVLGYIGKQKELYDQQIDSYQKDAKYKVSKLFADAWLTQKTLDEGLLAPTQLTNNEINSVLASLRADHDL